MARYLGFNVTTEKNYYFISYNTEDSERVSLFAKQLNDARIPLWYDDGLKPGEKWEEIVGEKLLNSIGIVFFFTENMLKKEESMAIKEYRIAKKQGIKIYVILIDELNKDYWKNYPKKSYFLDDIEQTHLIKNADELIKLLANNNSEKPKNNNSVNVESSVPIILDSEFLLNQSLISALALSEAHVNLDLLTVDAAMFPEALEVEGDASTWEEMVTQTADCSANLIINNKIVGYMDFVPVTPSDYDKLKVSPFNGEYVAFYAFGGRFDIFVSMFSIELNASIPSNYILFIKWMVDRIIEWKERDINIGRIEFCIYSKHQAKALENLGFKLTLTNKLKGMLYEIKVEDLLSNNLLMSRFGAKNIKKYEFVKITNDDEELMSQCKDIMYSHHVNNGGILQYDKALDESETVICCKYSTRATGYICLREYNVLKDSLYVEQIAVATNHQQLGLGTKLLNEAIKIAKERGLNYIYANCKKINEKSKKLLINNKFEQIEMSKEQYINIGIEESDIDKNIAFRLKLWLSLEDKICTQKLMQKLTFILM